MTRNVSEIYQLGYHDGEVAEKKAWLLGQRCYLCGNVMKSKDLTNICPKCWEEE